MGLPEDCDEIKVNTDSLSSQKISFVSRQIKDIKSWNFWRAVIAEYVGTCMLFMWSIGIGVHGKDQTPPLLLEGAIGTGFIVAAIINALLNVSGGHVNPIVSIGFLVTGHITCIRFLVFVIIQCVASISVVLTLGQLTSPDMEGDIGLILPAEGITAIQACVVEFILSFGLLLTITAFTDSRRNDDMSPSPMYVGLVVVANILFGHRYIVLRLTSVKRSPSKSTLIHFKARISGACFNPARSLGPALIAGVTKHQWVYWVGPMLGGASGAVLYDKFFSVKAMSRSTFSSCCKCKSRQSSDEEDERECQEILMIEKK